MGLLYKLASELLAVAEIFGLYPRRSNSITALFFHPFKLGGVTTKLNLEFRIDVCVLAFAPLAEFEVATGELPIISRKLLVLSAIISASTKPLTCSFQLFWSMSSTSLEAFVTGKFTTIVKTKAKYFDLTVTPLFS